MLTLKNITIKNFLSIGNQTQAVNLDRKNLTLIIGTNLDTGGEAAGSRNGVGKSALLNAISYGLYGQALTNIKKDNLINHINNKHMLVTIEFECDGKEYRIERGRKPNILRLFVQNQKMLDSATDDALGDSRDTQSYINQILNISHTMFKHIVALNTYTEPFLSMKAAEQREVIEQLLGITLLSEKAEKLKLLVKESKEAINIETVKIDSVKKANSNIQKSIDSLKLKSTAWDTKHVADLQKLVSAVEQLKQLDVEQEIALHEELNVWTTKHNKLQSLEKQLASYSTAQGQAAKNVKKYEREVETLGNKKCPQCEQELHDHTHTNLLVDAANNLADAMSYAENVNANVIRLQDEIAEIGKLGKQPDTFYDTVAEAHGHKNNVIQLDREIDTRVNEQNPFNEQIAELEKTALQQIDWTTLNELTRTKEHQDFLLKLLTNKDSFIRKQIIDQNLNYLNKRLGFYITKLGLPHRVQFQNDLSVEITNYGQDLDFDNLSRGERNRLILSTSFAFRDVWENLYQGINLLFVDELIDNGLDPAGVEHTVTVLKQISRERQKCVWVISHREELMSRFTQVLNVVKENGFTTFAND